MNLFPSNLAPRVHIGPKTPGKLTVAGMRRTLNPDGTRRAVATDRQRRLASDGLCADPQEYPELSAGASAPKGDSEALVPGDVCGKLFTAAAKLAKRFTTPVLTHVATVIGKEVTTCAATNLTERQSAQPSHVAGRFLAYDQTRPPVGQQPTLVVHVEAEELADLQKTLAQFGAGGDRVTRTFYDGPAERSPTRKPTSWSTSRVW